MNDAPRRDGKSNFGAWHEELFALNPWARGLDIDERNQAFEVARRKAAIDRHGQGMKAWNAWAKGMLDLQELLIRAGRWATRPARLSTFRATTGENEETRAWLGLGDAVFSQLGSDHCFTQGYRI